MKQIPHPFPFNFFIPKKATEKNVPKTQNEKRRPSSATPRCVCFHTTWIQGPNNLDPRAYHNPLRVAWLAIYELTSLLQLNNMRGVHLKACWAFNTPKPNGSFAKK